MYIYWNEEKDYIYKKRILKIFFEFNIQHKNEVYTKMKFLINFT